MGPVVVQIPEQDILSGEGLRLSAQPARRTVGRIQYIPRSVGLRGSGQSVDAVIHIVVAVHPSQRAERRGGVRGVSDVADVVESVGDVLNQNLVITVHGVCLEAGEPLQVVVAVLRAGVVAVLNTGAVAEKVVSYVFNIVVNVKTLVASHREQVASEVVAVLNPLPVRIGHLEHASPTVVYEIHGKGVCIVGIRHRKSTNILRNIAQSVVGKQLYSATVLYFRQLSGLIARGAISIFDIITCHITITFVPGPVVCIVVSGSHIIYNTIGRRKSTRRC